VQIKQWLENVLQQGLGLLPDQPDNTTQKPDMLTLIEEARREWLNAQRYFDSVSDPDLVDHAILLRQAAEKRYMYLLRLAREEGVRAFVLEPVSTSDKAASQ
jgi:hypothetical protein